MGESNVNDHFPIATNVCVLDDKIATIGLAVVLAHRMLWRCVDTPESWQIFSSASKIVLRASFVLPVCFLQVWSHPSHPHGVDVITMRVEGVPIAGVGIRWPVAVLA